MLVIDALQALAAVSDDKLRNVILHLQGAQAGADSAPDVVIDEMRERDLARIVATTLSHEGP